MKKPEITPNQAGGFDLLVERDAGNLVRILTGKNSMAFFKELRKVCTAAIDAIDLKNGPGINSKEFKAWKKMYEKQYPVEFAMFNDKNLYDIFVTS